MEHGSRGAGAEGNVVVVGAGASGVLSAAALLRARCSAVLVERDGSWSTGPAYATQDPRHLLNVPAGKLSADSTRPCDFVDWASTRERGVSAHSFLPRRLFGEYLRHSLEGAERAARPVALSKVSAEVTRIDVGCAKNRDRGPVRVELRGGRALLAAHVVLALGNPPSRALARDVDGVIDDPWSVGSSELVDSDDAVVIVGTGLTAIDAALTLTGRGHRGPIRMISRHGLLPRTHDPRCPRPLAAPDAPVPTARALVAWIRTAVADAGGDWRSVVDAIRPQTNDIWRRLPETERERLLRHAARHWEVHRHRVAPQVGRAVEALVGSGRLELSVGAVTCVERGTRDACRVVVRDARGMRSGFEAAWVINCTGPNFDLRDSASPLIRSLLRSGVARPGPLDQGLDVTRDGALIDRSGRVSSVVSVVGPLRRGAEWETTAIPEIRAQAETLATRVEAARRFRSPRGIGHGSPAVHHVARDGFDRRPELSGTEVA
jgi:uncharacterized NAD(P)/FAD-binding protein YdhS